MSLTSDLLFRRPVQLPVGKALIVSFLEKEDEDDDTCERESESSKNVITRERNREDVFRAVASGCRTSEDVKKVVGASHATVWKALVYMSKTMPIPLLRRRKIKYTYHYEVIDEEQSNERP